MFLESVASLPDQRNSVRKKEDALDPIASLEQFAKRDHSPCLAGTRRHHNQRLALHLREMLGHRADRLFLVVSFDNLFIDTFLREVFPFAAPLNQQLKFIALVKALYFTVVDNSDRPKTRFCSRLCKRSAGVV